MLTQLCYVSSATAFMSTSELADLLSEARRLNEAAELTGMLLYKDLSFLQVLEGPSDVVHRTYRHIRNDSRHDRVRLLFDHQIEEREFPDWTMGFQNLDREDIESLHGYSDVMTSEQSARDLFDNPSRAKRLLLFFRSRS